MDDANVLPLLVQQRMEKGYAMSDAAMVSVQHRNGRPGRAAFLAELAAQHDYTLTKEYGLYRLTKDGLTKKYKRSKECMLALMTGKGLPSRAAYKPKRQHMAYEVINQPQPQPTHTVYRYGDPSANEPPLVDVGRARVLRVAR